MKNRLKLSIVNRFNLFSGICYISPAKEGCKIISIGGTLYEEYSKEFLSKWDVANLRFIASKIIYLLGFTQPTNFNTTRSKNTFLQQT